MADLYGAQSIPLGTVGTPITLAPGAADPLLTYLGSYLQAVANARLGTEFAALMAPNRTSAAAKLPVAFVFDHDPEQFDFVDEKLPALFLFRTGDDASTYADVTNDLRVSTDTISLFWVLPSTSQDKQAIRARFPSKLFHLFDAAIEANRDPSWVLTGDADATAATRGSSLASRLNLFSMRMTRGPKRKPLVIRQNDGEKPLPPYPAYEGLLEVREMLAVDPTRNAALAGANVIIRTPDGGAGDGGIVLHDFDLPTP